MKQIPLIKKTVPDLLNEATQISGEVFDRLAKAEQETASLKNVIRLMSLKSINEQQERYIVETIEKYKVFDCLG